MKGLFWDTKQATIELLCLSNVKKLNLITSWFNCLFRYYTRRVLSFSVTFLTRVAASSSGCTCRTYMLVVWIKRGFLSRRCFDEESNRFNPHACRWRSESYCYSFKYRHIRGMVPCENAHEVLCNEWIHMNTIEMLEP